MLPRYRLTYKNTLGTDHSLQEMWIGRFRDFDSAERYAKQEWLGELGELVALRKETRSEWLNFTVERIFIRSLRICAGGVLAILAWAWLDPSKPDIGNVPLSALTLDMLFAAAFKIGIVVAAFWWGVKIAFGKGPST